MDNFLSGFFIFSNQAGSNLCKMSAHRFNLKDNYFISIYIGHFVSFSVIYFIFTCMFTDLKLMSYRIFL